MKGFYRCYFLFLQETVALTGIGNVKIYAREIFSATGSKIFVSAPNWDQKFSTAVAQTGQNGDDGKHGEPGPQGEELKLHLEGVVVHHRCPTIGLPSE